MAMARGLWLRRQMLIGFACLNLATFTSAASGAQARVAQPKLHPRAPVGAFAPLITYATASQLAACLTGPGITISNATITGAAHAFGTFSDSNATIGFTDGIILGTGDVMDVGGDNTSGAVGTRNGTAGDVSLAAVAAGTTEDAAVLQFDFSFSGPGSKTLPIDFVFASEEYNEFVGSEHSDAFAFFLDGTNAANNIARVPSSCTTPGGLVSVDTVNCGYAASRAALSGEGLNCGCYRNNDVDGPSALLGEMDGLTDVLQNEVAVGPGTHHVKIAIADVGDGAFDSNVFIRCGSMTSQTTSISVDFTSSGLIVPDTSLTLTAQLPATIRLEQEGVVQDVQLLGATFDVVTHSLTNRDFEPFTLTAANGSLGPCEVEGFNIPGATFALAEPGVGRIDYETGIFAVQMTVLATAPGYPPARFLTYTTGLVVSPTTVRLFMDGGSVSVPDPNPGSGGPVAIPAVPRFAAAILAMGLVGLGAFVLLFRRSWDR